MKEEGILVLNFDIFNLENSGKLLVTSFLFLMISLDIIIIIDNFYKPMTISPQTDKGREGSPVDHANLPSESFSR